MAKRTKLEGFAMFARAYCKHLNLGYWRKKQCFADEFSKIMTYRKIYFYPGEHFSPEVCILQAYCKRTNLYAWSLKQGIQWLMVKCFAKTFTQGNPTIIRPNKSLVLVIEVLRFKNVKTQLGVMEKMRRLEVLETVL